MHLPVKHRIFNLILGGGRRIRKEKSGIKKFGASK